MFKGISNETVAAIPAPLTTLEPITLLGVTDKKNYTIPFSLTQTLGWSGLISNTLDIMGSAFFRTSEYFIAISGSQSGTVIDKITYSPDGVQWGEKDLPFKRVQSAYCEHRGYYYVIGGFDGVSKDDVWRSSDGFVWDQIAIGCAFGAIQGRSVLSYLGNLYLCGADEIWQSTDDGLTWNLISAAPAFGNRSNMASVVFQGQMYLLGGHIVGVYQTDGYYSSDGIIWTPILNVFGIVTAYASAYVVDDKIFATGGTDGLGAYHANIRSSSDGLVWTADASNPIPAGRSSFGATVYDNKVWFYGGITLGALPETSVYYYGIGYDYYLNGNYVDRSDPAYNVASIGYYELITLGDYSANVVRFTYNPNLATIEIGMSGEVVSSSIKEFLAKANISGWGGAIGADNKIDISSVNPVFIDIYDDETFIESVLATDLNFTNNYKVEVLEKRNIRIFDTSTSTSILKRYLTREGV